MKFVFNYKFPTDRNIDSFQVIYFAEHRSYLINYYFGTSTLAKNQWHIDQLLTYFCSIWAAYVTPALEELNPKGFIGDDGNTDDEVMTAIHATLRHEHMSEIKNAHMHSVRTNPITMKFLSFMLNLLLSAFEETEEVEETDEQNFITVSDIAAIKSAFQSFLDNSLRKCSALGEINDARMFVACGASINAQDLSLRTPLHFACMRSELLAKLFNLDAGLVRKAMESHPEMVAVLLSMGANLSLANSNSQKPAALLVRDSESTTNELDRNTAQAIIARNFSQLNLQEILAAKAAAMGSAAAPALPSYRQ